MDSIRTKKHLVIDATEKERIISIIADVGISITSDLRDKTAIEILDYYSSYDQMEEIKMRLVDIKNHYTEKELLLCGKIFDKVPAQYEEIQPVYYENTYIDDCRLTKLS